MSQYLVQVFYNIALVRESERVCVCVCVGGTRVCVCGWVDDSDKQCNTEGHVSNIQEVVVYCSVGRNLQQSAARLFRGLEQSKALKQPLTSGH